MLVQYGYFPQNFASLNDAKISLYVHLSTKNAVNGYFLSTSLTPAASDNLPSSNSSRRSLEKHQPGPLKYKPPRQETGTVPQP